VRAKDGVYDEWVQKSFKVLAELKQYDESRQTLERALAIQSQELGPRHPWTANVIQGLARTEAAASNYERARALFEQNLDIWREKLGPEHPFTVVSNPASRGAGASGPAPGSLGHGIGIRLNPP